MLARRIIFVLIKYGQNYFTSKCCIIIPSIVAANKTFVIIDVYLSVANINESIKFKLNV